MKVRLDSVGAAWLVVCLIGCGGQRKGDLPPLVPVKGHVQRGNAPAIGGLLRFVPDPETPESRDWVITAEIQPDGSFEVQSIHSLSQQRGLGSPRGTFKVTYTFSGDQNQGTRMELLTLPQKITIDAPTSDLRLSFPAKK